jgi:hypothetical protein
MTQFKQKNSEISFLKDFEENKWKDEAHTENIFTQYIPDIDIQIKHIGSKSDLVLNEIDLNFLEDQLDFAIQTLSKRNSQSHNHKNKIENKYSGVKNFIEKFCN